VAVSTYRHIPNVTVCYSLQKRLLGLIEPDGPDRFQITILVSHTDYSIGHNVNSRARPGDTPESCLSVIGFMNRIIAVGDPNSLTNDGLAAIING
jgi:hypothetical protein